MADHPEDNDPFEEDIVFDEAGLLGGKMPRARRQATAGFLPTFMLFIRTVFLCVAFLGLGLCVSVSGGPLIKLEMSVGIPESTAFHVFTARSVGMLVGGALGSVLFEVYNRQFLLSVSLVWVAAAVTVLPFTVPAALWWTLASTAALGTGLAFIFTGGNVLCLDLWGRRQGGAALQALHFSFSLGALVVPLVVQPFFSGLHPAGNPNTTLSTPLMPEVTVAMRAVRAAVFEGTQLPHNQTTWKILSEEELLLLTQPKTSPTQSKGGNHTSSLPPTAPPHTPSTTKPPKKKPAYTDASKLKPDEVPKWTKAPASGQLHPPPHKNLPPTPPKEEQHKTHTTLTPTPLGDTQNTSGNGTVTQNTTTTTTPTASTTTATTKDSSKNTTTTTTTVNTNTTATAPSSTPTTAATTRTATTPTTTTSPTTTTPTPTTTTTIPSTTTPTATTTIPSTTTTTTTTTKAPPVVTPPPTTSTTSTSTTTSTTTVRPEPTTTSTTTTTTTTSKPQTTTITPSTTITTTLSALFTPVLVNDGGDDGGEVMPLTSEVEGYEVQDLRERLPSEGGVGTPSLKPGTFSNASEDKSRFLEHMAQRLGDYGVTRVHLAYISIGILVVVDALVSVVVLCHHPREARSRQEGGPLASARPARALLFTVLFSAFMFATEALQGALHHLLATTGDTGGLPLAWGGGEEGPDGQVVFWGLVCLVRFLCVPATGCLGPPGRLLAAAVVFSVAGAAFMVVGASGQQDFVWAGVVFLAMGCAPILPTSLLWMAQHMRVTHRLCALMVVVASFGNTLTHSLLAEVMGHPPTHAFVMLGLAMASACLLGASVCALHTGQHSSNLGAPVGYQLASQHEEDSLELTPSASVVFTPADAASHEGGEAGQALLID